MESKKELIIRLVPYALIAVNFVGWEIIKRTPIFVSTTISQQALRVHGAISGSILLILTCLLFGRFCLRGSRTFHLYGFEKYVFVLLLVDLIALMVGLVRRNAAVFLIGDTYKFAVIPLAYFCTTQTLKTREAEKLFIFILVLETVVTLESFLFYVIRLAAGVYERAPQHPVSLLALIFFLVTLTSEGQLSRKRRITYWSLLLVIGIIALLSQARTLWVQILLCPFILLLIERKPLVIKSVFKFAVCILILLIPILIYISSITQELGQRVTGTLELVRDAWDLAPALSGDRRVVETKSALNHYAESSNILNLLVGFGNGAEFYAPSAALGMGSRPGYKHHIHNGYLSLFFRMGITGLTAFLLFAFSALRSMYAVARHHDEKMPAAYLIMSKVIFVYLAATLLEFITIYSFIGDIKWGVLLGLFRSVSPNHQDDR